MQTTWQRLKNHPEKIEFLYKREKIVDTIRDFFKADGFLEIDSPLMVKSPGMEPYLEVFETTLIDDTQQKQRAFLLTSPEYALKKLLVTGIPKLFSICKSFRNGEGLSRKHNPEFSIMEWYRTNADYTDIMKDCENVFVSLSQKLGGSTQWTYQGKVYDIQTPWERISVKEAFEKYCEIDVDTLLDEEKLKMAGAKRGFQVTSETTWEQVYNQFFLNDIEPHLGVDKPTIIYDFPTSQASLSKKKDDDPRFAERFEFYVAGIEMGNAFSELTDGDEQLKRFEIERAERQSLGKTMYDIDMDYIEAIKAGLPPTGGIAVGIDRIVMFFADAPNIQDVLVFPAQELWTS
ncbi:MAG: EF-P lysine aminoacylase EpmA [Candidatus Woesebacteria bacterium]